MPSVRFRQLEHGHQAITSRRGVKNIGRRERGQLKHCSPCDLSVTSRQIRLTVIHKAITGFASRLVDLATNDKLIANELYGGQTPSPASSKAVKEIKDYCSQRL